MTRPDSGCCTLSPAMIHSRWKRSPLPGRDLLWVTLSIAITLSALPDGRDAASASSSIVTFNSKSISLAGVPLARLSATGPRGLAQHEVVPALSLRLGTPRIFSSSICSGHLRVTVATWNDLSVVFNKGFFAILYYNYRGWSMAQKPYPLPPPVGFKLRPLVRTEFGITVGDSAVTVLARDPHLRFDKRAHVFTLSPNSYLILSKRTGATGDSAADFVVSQIQTAIGNC